MAQLSQYLTHIFFKITRVKLKILYTSKNTISYYPEQAGTYRTFFKIKVIMAFISLILEQENSFYFVMAVMLVALIIHI